MSEDLNLIVRPETAVDCHIVILQKDGFLPRRIKASHGEIMGLIGSLVSRMDAHQDNDSCNEGQSRKERLMEVCIRKMVARIKACQELVKTKIYAPGGNGGHGFEGQRK